MNFEEFLKSKNIDARAFESAENGVFNAWKSEFEQMHPNSFTLQKLNLINPIRRKYLLAADVKVEEKPPVETTPPANVAAKVARPVMKPKPKMN